MSGAIRQPSRIVAGVANSPKSPSPSEGRPARVEPRQLGARPIRMLRLPQVIDTTGLGKTKIYELQAEGAFPMRVKITSHSVAWVEEEVQAWLAARIETNCVPNLG